MKIIQVMPNFALAGAEIMCENLVYGLKKQGVEVVIVSLFDDHSVITERLEKQGIKIIYLNKKLGMDFSIIRKLCKVFKQEKPDVIHTHRYATEYAIPAAVLAGVKKRVHTVHNVAQKENGRLGRFLNRCFFKINHVVPVALSAIVQESIEKEYKIKKEKIPVVFNGIDLSKCLPKTEYATTDNTLKILHIGRFMQQKNHQGLIEAFSIFHEKFPKSVLQLIGEGDLRGEIEKMVAEKGLKDAVEFLGLQDNVYGYLHDADMFTLPSLYEGIPMTLIEAMGTGLPIVATKVGGVPDMLVDGESAILTDVDTEKIAKAFLELAEDQEKRKLLGESAKKAAVPFSAETMAEEYLKIYKKR